MHLTARRRAGGNYFNSRERERERERKVGKGGNIPFTSQRSLLVISIYCVLVRINNAVLTSSLSIRRHAEQRVLRHDRLRGSGN